MSDQTEVDTFVNALSAEQRRIDADREAMADEILAGQHVTSLDEALRFARSWIVTAAQYAANADYYRDERDRLLRVVEQANGQLSSSRLNMDHIIASHDGELPPHHAAGLRQFAAGHAAALETLQAVIHERLEPSPPTLRGSLSENLAHHED
jgi:hypothetical protein